MGGASRKRAAQLLRRRRATLDAELAGRGRCSCGGPADGATHVRGCFGFGFSPEGHRAVRVSPRWIRFLVR